MEKFAVTVAFQIPVNVQVVKGFPDRALLYLYPKWASGASEAKYGGHFGESRPPLTVPLLSARRGVGLDHHPELPSPAPAGE